jgi:hypothetical protein
MYLCWQDAHLVCLRETGKAQQVMPADSYLPQTTRLKKTNKKRFQKSKVKNTYRNKLEIYRQKLLFQLFFALMLVLSGHFF